MEYMQIPALLQKINPKLILVTPRLIKKKPQLLIRALKTFLFMHFMKPRLLQSVLFHTHYKCNLNCKHCYEKNFNKTNREPLTLLEKKKIISDCLKLGVFAFDFVSGESSMDPDLPELIEACQPRRSYITLATNGYGFTEEKIKYFLNIGVDKMNISIDSWFSDKHDMLRGKEGSHQSAFKTIQLCKKVGMGFQINTFIYRNFTKTDDFKKLVEYAVNNRIRLTFKAAVPLGAWQGKHHNLITEDDNQFMFELHKKYPFLVRTCISSCKSTCPAFGKLVAITSYGDVLPCNTVHVSFGNLRNEYLGAIINRGRAVKYFNGRFKGCPPAEDREFITTYLSKGYNVYPYPAQAKQVFEEIAK